MLTRANPLVELRAFGNANFAFGSLFSFVLGIGLYGSVYLVPLFLGEVRGYDSLQIGETMFVAGAAMFLSAPIAGQLARRIDLRVMLAAGLVMFGGGVWWMAHLTVDFGVLGVVLAAGAARRVDDVHHAAGQPGRAGHGLAPAALKNASGLYNLMRNLGGAVGLAAINTVATAAAGAPHPASGRASDLGARGGDAVRQRPDAGADRGEGGEAHLAALRQSPGWSGSRR